MKLILSCLLGLLVVCSGQYTSDVQNYDNNIPSTVCQTGFDCVHKSICVGGTIDTTGGGLIDKRIKATTCTGDNVCCRIPGYVEPLGTNQCNKNEDCVSYKICSKDGVIDVTGGDLIDKRIKAPNTCVNHEFPELSAVCCLIPYKCPEYQECVLDSHCGTDGFIDKSGSLSTYLQKGIPCNSDDGSIQGVCCTPGPVKEILPIAQKCGVRHDDNQNFVNGYGKQDAKFGEFPWMGIIFLAGSTDQLLFQCGATLISDRHVLTAAHCVNLLQPHDIGVRFGEYEVSSVKEVLPYVDRKVKHIAVHKDYQPANTRNNIALLELDQPVKFDYHINTICLTDSPTKFTHRCVATGWGKDNFKGNYQHILKKVDLPFVEHSQCQHLLRQTHLSRYFVLHQSFSCAGGEEGVDTCTGDGGGPLVCIDDISGQYYLAGIISSGLKCGQKNVPGLYVNAPYFSKWIEDQIHSFGSNVGSLPGYGK